MFREIGGQMIFKSKQKPIENLPNIDILHKLVNLGTYRE